MDNHLLNLFVSENGQYAKSLRFEVIVVMIITIIFLTFYFSNTYGFVIILVLFVIYVGNTFVGIKTQKVTDFNKITLYKMQKIQNNVNNAIKLKIEKSNKTGIKLSQKEIQKIYDNNKITDFYIDANMIYFIDSISPIYDYNPYEYFTFIKGVNNILKLRREIEDYYEANKKFPININEMLEISLQLKSNTINNLHTFIYSVPKQNKMYKYVDDIIQRYTLLINRNIDIIYEYYKTNIDIKGINTTTKFIYPELTKPYEQLKNHNITLIKKGNTAYQQPDTIPFYI